MKHFIGVDGEMTAVQTDLMKGDPPARLCQIGVALGAADVYTQDIGWADGDYGWSERALEVNNFTHKRIQEGSTAEDVDADLHAWLSERGVGEKDGIAVGWNVAHFDFAQFIIPTLPRTAALFGYRYVDLNSICFAFQAARDLLSPALVKGPEQKFDTWKTRAKEISAQVLGAENFHDAGYDAAASLFQFQWLAMQIGAGVFK